MPGEGSPWGTGTLSAANTNGWLTAEFGAPSREPYGGLWGGPRTAGHSTGLNTSGWRYCGRDTWGGGVPRFCSAGLLAGGLGCSVLAKEGLGTVKTGSWSGRGSGLGLGMGALEVLSREILGTRPTSLTGPGLSTDGASLGDPACGGSTAGLGMRVGDGASLGDPACSGSSVGLGMRAGTGGSCSAGLGGRAGLAVEFEPGV